MVVIVHRCLQHQRNCTVAYIADHHPNPPKDLGLPYSPYEYNTTRKHYYLLDVIFCKLKELPQTGRFTIYMLPQICIKYA